MERFDAIVVGAGPAGSTAAFRLARARARVCCCSTASAFRATSPAAALLVGDAAGLVDPFSGDGIYEALVSSRLAARAALDLLGGYASDLEPYAECLARELNPLASASWRVKVAFDRFPRLSYALARTPPGWALAERLLRGDVAQPGDATGLLRAPVKALKLLGA